MNEEFFDTFFEMTKKYREKFGDNYPFTPTSNMTYEEAIEDMGKCIESGKPAEEPDFDEELVY